jgi:multisubunit Na+/H+ antiporter MnhE subunit
MALWLLLTSTVSLNEVITGFGAATVSATAAALAHGVEHLPIRLDVGYLRVLSRIPQRVAVDTALLVRALVRRLAGYEVSGRFRELSWSPPRLVRERHGLEAFSAIVTTMSPNHVVVGYDPEKRTVLVHELIARPAEALDEVMRAP